MSLPPLRIAIFEMDYFIALDIQRAIADTLGWPVAIISAGDWDEMLATTDFDLVVTRLSPASQDNSARSTDIEHLDRGIVFTSTMSVDEPKLAGAHGWPIVDVPFTDQMLVDAVRTAASRFPDLSTDR